MLCLLGVGVGCAVWLAVAVTAATAGMMLLELGQHGLATLAFAVELVGVAACGITALVAIAEYWT